MSYRMFRMHTYIAILYDCFSPFTDTNLYLLPSFPCSFSFFFFFLKKVKVASYWKNKNVVKLCCDGVVVTKHPGALHGTVHNEASLPVSKL